MFTVIIKSVSVITLLATMIIGTSNERSIENREERSDIRSEIRLSPIDGKYIPTEMNYQGYLISVFDTSAVNDTLNMTFELFTQETGGTSFWSENHSAVIVSKGLFNLLLGSITSLNITYFSGDPLWLQTTVESEVLTPRKKIVSTAYSFRAQIADTADYVINGAPDNDWTISGSVLYPFSAYGLAMNGNVLYGSFANTHVCLGVNCTTGTPDQNHTNNTVSGGYSNTALESVSTVSGGYDNTASGSYSTVGGGYNNTALQLSSTISGGSGNTASGWYSTISGGLISTASGDYSTVSGGYDNTASGVYSTVSGGYNNTAYDTASTVSGGEDNSASGNSSTIGGGIHNISSYRCATVGGGWGNTSSGSSSTVGGGYDNTSSKALSTVSGGISNTASGEYSTVSGGGENTALGECSAVSGGGFNYASGDYSTVSGGWGNVSSGSHSTVGGGNRNINSGNYSTIPNGRYVNVSGDYSLGFGRGTYTDSINVIDNYDIVFGDGGYDYQFGINRENPSYPLHIGTNSSNGNGARLTAGGVWTNGCSRTFKENFTKPDPYKILELVKKLDIFRYNYKGDAGVYHISPVAEDFYDLFETGNDERYLAGIDVSGVALLAIKALAKENEEILVRVENNSEEIIQLRRENQELRSEIEQMRADIEMLKRLNNLDLNN